LRFDLIRSDIDENFFQSNLLKLARTGFALVAR